jgi:2'-5' RNA ligase
MKRKIFISINIPEKVKKRLVLAIEKWHDLPVKWVKEANLHITLLFLGYVDEETLPEICQKVREATESEDIFDIEFNQIELFPSPEEPKMIALTGPASEELLKLHEKLEKELNIFTVSKKSFCPHITLGRGRKYKWEALESKPSIKEKYSLIVSAETIDVMASDFGDGSSEYTVIESCPLH